MGAGDICIVVDTQFNQRRLAFAVKRLGLQTAEDLERWLTRPEKVLPPDEMDRRRAEVQQAVPRLRPHVEKVSVAD